MWPDITSFAISEYSEIISSHYQIYPLREFLFGRKEFGGCRKSNRWIEELEEVRTACWLLNVTLTVGNIS